MNKQELYTKVTMIFTGLILAALLVFGLMFVPKINNILNSTEVVMENLAKMDFEALNEGIDSTSKILSSLDIEKLNGTISSLKEASEDLQKISRSIASLFGR